MQSHTCNGPSCQADISQFVDVITGAQLVIAMGVSARLVKASLTEEVRAQLRLGKIWFSLEFCAGVSIRAMGSISAVTFPEKCAQLCLMKLLRDLRLQAQICAAMHLHRKGDASIKGIKQSTW